MDSQDQTQRTPISSNPTESSASPNPVESPTPLISAKQSPPLNPAESPESTRSPISMDSAPSTEPTKLTAIQPVSASQPAAAPLSPTPITPENPPISPALASATDPKKPKGSQKIGLLAACVLLLAGSAFTAIRLLEQNNKSKSECIDCNTPTDKPSSTPVAASADDLDYAFLKLEHKSENLIYSPLSIKNGLSLLSRGAANETKAEIDAVLGDSTSTHYDDIENTLSVANAVFIRNGFSDKVSPDYISTAESELNAEIIYDDFNDSSKMDDWISKKTFNLIPQIGLQPESDTEMILANALAIQMDWLHHFDDDDTSGQSFYAKNGEEITATTMHKETDSEDIKYYVDDDITAITLPLDSTTSTKLEFVAVMPKNSSLTDYTQSFGATTFDSLRAKFQPASDPKDGIILSIPKFKFDYTLDFVNDLNALGITKAFSPTAADFSVITSNPLYVSTAIHKANIDFSEDGIKAAAVTAFLMKDGAAFDTSQPIMVQFDHPFLFLIRDQETNTVWFAGTVYQPNLWENDQAEYREKLLM